MESQNKNNISTNSILTAEGILAGDVGHSLAQWTAKTFNHNFDEYDRAIDLVYNTTKVGGSQYHHLIDGQHDIFGAFKAVQGVNVDDSWLTEISKTCEHLLRDTASVSGINPFFSLTEDQFNSLSSFVSTFGISKPYLADALTINAPELLGGAIALTSTLILAKDSDSSKLSTLAGGCLLSSFISANPLLLPIAAGGMVKAIGSTDDYRQVFACAGKGALISGSATLASNLVGGPVWLGCVAGILGAVAVSSCFDSYENSYSNINALFRPFRNISQDAASKINSIIIKMENPYNFINQSRIDLKKQIEKIDLDFDRTKGSIQVLYNKAEKKLKIAKEYRNKAVLLLQKVKNNQLDKKHGEDLALKALVLEEKYKNEANDLISSAKNCGQALIPSIKKINTFKANLKSFEYLR